MKIVDFYSLPRAAQERFISSTRGQLAPRPLAVAAPTKHPQLGWFGAAGLVALTAIATVAWGFGRLDSTWALTPTWLAVSAAVLLSVALSCLVRGLTLYDRLRQLPYARGVYLFPAGLIDASDGKLSVYPIGEIRAVRRQSDALTLELTAAPPFSFRNSDAEALDHAQRAVGECRQLDQTPSVRQRAALDPLYHTDYPAPLSSDRRLRPANPGAAIGLLLVSGLVGAALGLSGVRVRDALSERALFQAARSLDSVQGYRDYLARGGTRAEVARTLLPRAELAAARATQSVAAIEAFAAAHPQSAIQTEVEAALRQSLLRELRWAQQRQSLEALQQFALRFPQYGPVAVEWREARHALFDQARQRFDALAATGPSGQRASRLVKRLLSFSERHGPEVSIRFRRRLGPELEQANETVRRYARGRYYRGRRSLPARYFTRSKLKPLEAAAGRALVASLQSAFSPELLRFKLAARLRDLPSQAPGQDAGAESALAALGELTEPVLVVDYHVDLGGLSLDRARGDLFLHTAIALEPIWVLPGEGVLMQTRLRARRGPSAELMQNAEARISDIYGDMTQRVLQRLVQRYLQLLLKRPPPLAWDQQGELAAAGRPQSAP